MANWANQIAAKDMVANRGSAAWKVDIQLKPRLTTNIYYQIGEEILDEVRAI